MTTPDPNSVPSNPTPDASTPAETWWPPAPGVQESMPPLEHAYPTRPMPGGADEYDRFEPNGIDPKTGVPYSDKSKVVAALLQFFLGFFGIGRFYLGNNTYATVQLLVNIGLSIVTLGLWTVGAGIWAIVDTILILTDRVKDGEGRPLR